MMQPMETAPKDGTKILLWYDSDMSGFIEGWWFASPKEVDNGWETIIGFIGEPAMWTTLPLLPNGIRGDGAGGGGMRTGYEQGWFDALEMAHHVAQSKHSNLAEAYRIAPLGLFGGPSRRRRELLRAASYVFEIACAMAALRPNPPPNGTSKPDS